MVIPLMSQIVIGIVVVAVMIVVASVLVVRRIVRGQCLILREMREWTRLKRIELSMRLRTPAEREPAADERDPDEIRAEILAEIQAGPYCPVHIRPDLPPGRDTIRLHTPEGPVTVRRPARHRRPVHRRPSARGTYRGLAAVPVLGAAWRALTALAQGTAAVGGAAAAGIMLSPAPMVPPAEADQPPAVIRALPGRDVHLQKPATSSARPAAPGQPLPPPMHAVANEEKEIAPVPPPSPAPPRVRVPAEPEPEPVPVPVETVPVLPEPTATPTSPAPTTSPTPSVSPEPARTATPTPTPSLAEQPVPDGRAPTVLVTVTSEASA